jgi:hexosaminidase
MKGLKLLVMLFALTSASWRQSAGQPALLPLPMEMTPGQGRFLVDKSFSVQIRGSIDERVKHAAERFLGNLARRTGVAGSIGAEGSSFMIICDSPGEKVQKLGEDESYRLEIDPNHVHLEAATPLGVIHGLQTFLQLLQNSSDGFYVPAMAIEDRPRFPWRGLLIDVSRHFMPVEAIKRNLDGMEAVKFNVLHWHLSDDQGFRVESKKFSKFQQLSSDGQYYTQDQIKDIIAYARDRGIRVVPEFDIPGHTTSWFAAYPELASALGPYQISRHFGVHDAAMDPSSDHTYRFLDDFIGEMARLFPDTYFHIGGDEVNGKQWQASSKIRQFEQKHRLKNGHDLQAYFNQRLQKIVTRQGKLMIGWEEILHAELPKDVVVQSWRGQKSLADTARQGYRSLLSFGYYLDLMQPAAQHYSIDPLANEAAGLTLEEQQRVLGGEACMWAEFVIPENIDGRIWPRAAAVAERLWSAEEVRDIGSMYSRLQSTSDYLASIGLLHQSEYLAALRRLAGTEDPSPLRILADVLEPVKGYARPRSRAYETTTPLNRLVDAVQPESDAGREFAGRVQRLLENTKSEQKAAEVRNALLAWRDNEERVEPILRQNPLLNEVVPVANSLKAVADAGLQALDYLRQDAPPPAGWHEQQVTTLKQAQQPQAELLNMIALPVLKLVEATKAE